MMCRVRLSSLYVSKAHPVAEIVHDKGVLFHFEGEPKIPWRWQEMVAQLDDESMRFVVEGLDTGDKQNRSRGLVQCSIQETDRYDHQRHNALQATEEMMKN